MDIIVDITGVGGATNLQALTDVDTSGATNGQVLTYTGAGWEPTAAAGVTTLSALDDTDTAGVTDGQILIYNNATGNFEAGDLPAGGSSTWGSITGTLSAQTDLQSALDAKANTSHTHVKADITDFNEADYATAAQGTLASTATQPGDNVSLLTNDAGYITSAPVTSVAGKTGVVTLVEADITDLGTYVPTSEKASANGIATLDGSGLIPSNQLPGLALTTVNTVATEVAQLALVAQQGDVAIRSDLNKSYAHNGGVAGTMADWSELLTPTDTVLSVDGRTGAVSLSDLYATAAQGSTADTAVQPGDNVSTLTNDAGFITSAPVTSVAGKTGVVTLNKSDITDFTEGDYATSAQGALAGTALQNLSTEPLTGLSDVTITTPATDQVLTYNGTNWINDNLASLGFDINGVSTAPSASGTNSLAIGNTASASNTFSSAVGPFTSASGLQSTAMGLNCSAEGLSSIAIGFGASTGASASGSMALGFNVSTDAASQLRLGTTATSYLQYETDALTLTGTNAQYVLPNYATASLPTGTTGGLVYDSDTTEAKVYDGSNWVSVTGQSKTTLQTVDATPGTLATIAVPTDEEKIITVKVHGHEDATDDHIWKTMTFGVKNIAGTATLVGGLDSAVGYDAGATTWEIVAGVSLGNATVTVTGEAAHTINWRATITVD